MVKQYEIHLINLDPTVGREIKKTRPCVVISPNEMNDNLGTVIIAPLTSQVHRYPTRIAFKLEGKNGEIILDQIRTVDKTRLIKKLGQLNGQTIKKVKETLFEMLVQD